MRALALLIAAQVLSCQPAGIECTTTAQCGGLQACIQDRCREVECVAASDCDLEFYCSNETFTCEAGCATSDDCFVGDRCDVETNTCVPRTCDDTQLDCDLGERCDTATRTCVQDPAPHCKPCRSDQACGASGVCAVLSTTGQAYCILECSPEAADPCPAGLQCSAQVDEQGNPAGHRCVGHCGGL